MRLYKEGKVWHIDITHKGRRYRRSLFTASKTIADKLSRHKIKRLESGLPFDEQESKLGAKVKDLVGEYAMELQRRGRKRNTVLDCCNKLIACVNDAEVTYINELDAQAVERGLAYLRDRSSRTQNRVLGHFKAFFTWLNKTGRWDKNPAMSISRVKEVRERPRRRALNDDEIERLTRSDAIPEHRRLVYLLAINTGMRRREINKATWNEVDLERCEIFVRENASKNGKEATIPVNQEVMKAWTEWLRSPWVKIGGAEFKTDKPLPPVPYMETLRRDMKAVGIEEVTNAGRVDFHALRVTFCSLLARRGVSLQMAQKLMRHSTVSLTADLYTVFATEDTREAVESLNKKEAPQRAKRREA